MSNILKLWKLYTIKNFLTKSQIKYLSTTAETIPQVIIDDEEAQLYTRVIKKKPERKPFMKNAFLAEFDYDVLGFPEVLDNEELNVLNNRTSSVTNFISSILPNNEIEQSILSKEVREQCRNLNLFGLQAPIRTMGLELSETENCRILEEVSKCSSLAISMLNHQYFGVKAVAKSGTEEAKDKYLRCLSSGEYLSAFCLLEENSMDISQMNSQAIPQEDGSFVSNLTDFN